MKTKIVTAYWMDVEGYPYQGVSPIRKIRYQGSLISHCIGSGLPVICYTHSKNYEELNDIKISLEQAKKELDQNVVALAESQTSEKYLKTINFKKSLARFQALTFAQSL